MRKGCLFICIFIWIFLLFAITAGDGSVPGHEVEENYSNSDLKSIKHVYSNEDINALFKWTIMVYMAADNDLEEAGVNDLWEMRDANFGSEICVVVEFDGWDSCLVQDTDNSEYNASQRFRILGAGGAFINLDNTSEERNMGDPRTLRNFIEFSINKFPAEHYCLVIWNHGLGWETGVEEWTDYTSTTNLRGPPNILQNVDRSFLTRQKGVCWDDRSFGDTLTESELTSALSDLPDTLDVIAFDACLMGCIEVAYAIRNDAKFMVASEDSIGLSGFYYTGFLNKLSDFTSDSGIDPVNYGPERCAQFIVQETYDNLFNHRELSMDIIQLGVIDLSKIQGLSNDLSELAEFINVMESAQLSTVCAELSFLTEFGLSEQIDLVKVVDVINRVSDEAISALKADILLQMQQTCVYQRYNNSIITSPSGLTVYAPWCPELWISDYSEVSSFGEETGWSEAVSKLYKEGAALDVSDFILSHDNPSITNRIKQNEVAIIFLSLHWKEKITLKLTGPSQTDFDMYLFDFEFNLLDESYEEDYPETVSYTAHDESESLILLIHAYEGSGNFDLDATYSTSNALVEFIGCVGMFVTDSDNNSKIDDIQIVLAFDSPASNTVKFHLKVVDHADSFILEWNQTFNEGTEITVLDLPFEELYKQIETLLPSQRWECFYELSIIEPTKWQHTFRSNPLIYLIKLSDLDHVVTASVAVTPGQIINVEPLNPPSTPSSKPTDNYFEIIIIGLLALVLVGGVGYWFMRKRTSSVYKKGDQYGYSFQPTRTTPVLQFLAVCPSCGIVYQVTSKIQVCPTCQVKLHSIVK
ncbi:hypothetical protein CEE45_14930 [Candidatus Heimdallarchaeota archaeon B3_Heim]|nr:MAG: hypothetical protein CEE45_14930 [Candidatus Heimdallarchaeota archaeon B3_Heim]